MRAIGMFLFLVIGTPATAAIDGPFGERRGTEFQRNLDRLYAGRPVSPEAWRDVEGRAAACLLLGHVTRHMRDVGRASSEKNLTMLSWALQLVRFDTARTELPFVHALTKKRLFALLDRYRTEPKFVETIVGLMDATNAWTPRHLAFLAERAGRNSLDERLWDVERARLTGPWEEEDARRMLRYLRSTLLSQRTDEQWGLIGLTGLATPRELVRILLLAAAAFADGDPESRVLDDEHPIRRTLEDLVERFDADDRLVVAAVDAAEEISEREAGPGLVGRTLFFEAIHNDVEIVEAPPKRESEKAPARRVRFRSRFAHEGNVYYPFGRGCDLGLSREGR